MIFDNNAIDIENRDSIIRKNNISIKDQDVSDN